MMSQVDNSEGQETGEWGEVRLTDVAFTDGSRHGTVGDSGVKKGASFSPSSSRGGAQALGLALDEIQELAGAKWSQFCRRINQIRN